MSSRRNCAGLKVEDAFVGGGAVGADDLVAGGAAVGGGDAQQLGVARLVGGVEDDRHVHHDVDEQRISLTNDRRYWPFSLKRIASVRPA